MEAAPTNFGYWGWGVGRRGPWLHPDRRAIADCIGTLARRNMTGDTGPRSLYQNTVRIDA